MTSARLIEFFEVKSSFQPGNGFNSFDSINDNFEEKVVFLLTVLNPSQQN